MTFAYLVSTFDAEQNETVEGIHATLPGAKAGSLVYTEADRDHSTPPVRKLTWQRPRHTKNVWVAKGLGYMGHDSVVIERMKVQP